MKVSKTTQKERMRRYAKRKEKKKSYLSEIEPITET